MLYYIHVELFFVFVVTISYCIVKRETQVHRVQFTSCPTPAASTDIQFHNMTFL